MLYFRIPDNHNLNKNAQHNVQVQNMFHLNNEESAVVVGTLHTDPYFLQNILILSVWPLRGHLAARGVTIPLLISHNRTFIRPHAPRVGHIYYFCPPFYLYLSILLAIYDYIEIYTVKYTP